MYLYHDAQRFGEVAGSEALFGKTGIQVLMAQKLPSAVVQRFNECRGGGIGKGAASCFFFFD